MSNEWNDLVKEVSPHEEAVANKKLEEAAKKERYIEKEIPVDKKNKAWNYERKMFYKMLGWEMMGTVSHGTRHATGKEEYVITSENTFERREKVNYTFTDYEKIRLDKTKISDFQVFDELNKEISEFLSQAEEKIGKNVAPALFRNKDCIRYLFDGFKKSELIIGVLVLAFMTLISQMFIMIPLFALIIGGGAVLLVYLHRKKNASYLPLIEAYHNKVKEFEERAKQITLF